MNLKFKFPGLVTSVSIRSTPLNFVGLTLKIRQETRLCPTASSNKQFRMNVEVCNYLWKNTETVKLSPNLVEIVKFSYHKLSLLSNG
jgi:hypothetical protein